MRRILIFGNSASGKTTLARTLCAAEGLAHLDLDTLAWLPVTPPERRPLLESQAEIIAFVRNHESWIIEGCYADLLKLTAAQATEMIYLHTPLEQCLANARKRPWEEHKYTSKEAQDANLDMLLDWIADYAERDGPCSAREHQDLYNAFTGMKRSLAGGGHC